jgi:hypothetical protein
MSHVVCVQQSVIAIELESEDASLRGHDPADYQCAIHPDRYMKPNKHPKHTHSKSKSPLAIRNHDKTNSDHRHHR